MVDSNWPLARPAPRAPQRVDKNIFLDPFQPDAFKHLITPKTTKRILITNPSDIESILIPFFNDHPLLTLKNDDFLDFKNLFELKKQKYHTTPQGLSSLLHIKNNMNRGRKS